MADQHDADLQRVTAENDYTDITRAGEHLPQGGGLFTRMVNGVVRTVAETNPHKSTVWGSTDFDGKNLALNQMLDLVAGTDPEDLETSGRALWNARDAIKTAADELKGHIDKVHWVGESGQAFRTWGTNLVESTTALSTFAGGAGDQISAAAVGLASVRGAMPSRDTESNRKRPEHFTAAEKTANKEDYAAAVRVEKDRQEAINQMNRLASYYAVSSQELGGLKAPTFESMPDVGVPQPEKSIRKDTSGSASGSHGSTGTASPAGHHATVTSDVARHVTSDQPTPAKDVTGKITRPDEPVGTNIDSVGTLPPATTTPVTGHTPPVTGTPATGGGQTNLFGGGYGTPIPSGISGRNVGGSGGVRTPASTQGRGGTSGLGNSGSGRSTGPMGRATTTGQSAARGAASAAKPSPMGRGVTGGTPRASGATTPRANGGPTTGAGRKNGVVGGRPTTAAGSPAKGGSRIPRGTVIGAEETANSRSATGRPGQRGVFGAPETTTARPGSSATTSRGVTRSSEAVSGRPAERNSAARAERNGMTRGGAGLVRGPGSKGKPGDEGNAEGAPRPDYLVEDEETHLPNKPRRDVPPVVN
ncbi:WXG100 family type VII secretion target [Streptomyces olivochromogenes]|uniref:PPE family domain-containing protein n=1 Tax=Streptomyces olivochromogenes TaxID=1963 RepID=A0A250VBU0_STROL|nr:hypothetical protein [Streptomyces olivochromogenes]GAX51470.1 hypothetical protein SO3561_02972 [Streptomyces olivochromogenes]